MWRNIGKTCAFSGFFQKILPVLACIQSFVLFNGNDGNGVFKRCCNRLIIKGIHCETKTGLGESGIQLCADELPHPIYLARRPVG